VKGDQRAENVNVGFLNVRRTYPAGAVWEGILILASGVRKGLRWNCLDFKNPRPFAPGFSFKEHSISKRFMSFRFEFDPVNRILLTRMEGRLTDELLAQTDRETRKCASVIDPLVHIVECSAVTQFAVSSDLVRKMAKDVPILPDPRRHRFFVVPAVEAFGLARMFQIAAEPAHPLIKIVRTLDEVWVALGIQTPKFEPLESSGASEC
jgi:hypothetical protein